MKKFMQLEEIKSAIEAGRKVFWKNSAYEVIKDSAGQWLIRCVYNDNCTGLTRADGVTMNGYPAEFYCI